MFCWPSESLLGPGKVTYLASLVPNLVIAVPTRHMHSHAGIIHRDDYDRTVQLVTAVVKKLDAATVANLTK